jgi:hypothetical protein
MAPQVHVDRKESGYWLRAKSEVGAAAVEVDCAQILTTEYASAEGSNYDHDAGLGTSSHRAKGPIVVQGSLAFRAVSQLSETAHGRCHDLRGDANHSPGAILLNHEDDMTPEYCLDLAMTGGRYARWVSEDSRTANSRSESVKARSD